MKRRNGTLNRNRRRKKKYNDSLLRISQPRINDCQCTRTSRTSIPSHALCLSLSFFFSIYFAELCKFTLWNYIHRKKIRMKIRSDGFLLKSYIFYTQTKLKKISENSPIKPKLESARKIAFHLFPRCRCHIQCTFSMFMCCQLWSDFNSVQFNCFVLNHWTCCFFVVDSFFKQLLIVGIYLRLLLNKITFIRIRHPVEKRKQFSAF